MVDEFYIRQLKVVDSTNNYARLNADALWNDAGNASMVAVIANEQTAGRGQRGNIWHSLAGENMLLTVLVRPTFLAPARQFILSQAVALAVCDAMRSYGVDARLKWPNDIYVGEKKLSGILVELDYEADYISQAIIGIGLNVNQSDFPPLERRPVSMKMLLNSSFDVKCVASSVLRSFARRYSSIIDCAPSIMEEYKRLLIGRDAFMEYSDAAGKFLAVIEDVEPDGHLILRRRDGAIGCYAFKEVELFI